MKFTLLAFVYFAFASIWAQTTHTIDWKDPTVGAAADIEIQVGDTVKWVWGDSMTHDVASDDPDAPSDFQSSVSSSKGFVYEYTFTEVAEIDYYCTFHIDSMEGTISVVENLGTSSQKEPSFKVYPNPVKDRIYFQNRSNTSRIDVTFYDILGKVVKREALGANSIRNGMDVSNLKRGVYLVQIDNGSNSFTQKLIKN